jgi:hypothetical protein
MQRRSRRRRVLDLTAIPGLRDPIGVSGGRRLTVPIMGELVFHPKRRIHPYPLPRAVGWRGASGKQATTVFLFLLLL